MKHIIIVCVLGFVSALIASAQNVVNVTNQNRSEFVGVKYVDDVRDLSDSPIPTNYVPTAFDGMQDQLSTTQSAEKMALAAENIQKYRKGEFAIKVIDAKTRKPITKKVDIELSNHKFKFGVSIIGLHSQLDKYPAEQQKAYDAINDVFNTVTVCDYFKSNAVSGYEQLASAKKDEEWAKKNNKYTRFHTIFFTLPEWLLDRSADKTNDKSDWQKWNVRNSVDGKQYADITDQWGNRDMSSEACWSLLESRLDYVAQYYGDTDQYFEYDVINEFVNQHHWSTNRFYKALENYPDFRDLDNANRILDMVKSKIPNAQMVILDTSIPSTTPHEDLVGMNKFTGKKQTSSFLEYVDFLTRLSKVRQDFVCGYQAHFYTNNKPFEDGSTIFGKDTYSMGQVSDALDMLDNIGLPVAITEFNGPSRSNKSTEEANDKVWTMSDMDNAMWQINFYRLAFSKPNFYQITRWFLMDDMGGRGVDAGLLEGMEKTYQDKDDLNFGDKHKIYDMLQYLIKNEWHTHLNLKANSNGVLGVKGFYGDYVLKVKGYEDGHITLNESGDYEVTLNQK